MTRKLATSCITVVVDSLCFRPLADAAITTRLLQTSAGPSGLRTFLRVFPPNRGPDETGSAISATLNEVPMSHRSKWQWSRDNLKRAE